MSYVHSVMVLRCVSAYTIHMQAVARFVAAINQEIINPIIGLLFTAALFLFLFGAAKLVFQAGEDAKRAEGKQHMLWGMIGMVIMVSVFAIIRVLLFTFEVQGTLPAELPLQL